MVKDICWIIYGLLHYVVVGSAYIMGTVSNITYVIGLFGTIIIVGQLILLCMKYIHRKNMKQCDLDES